MMLVQKQPHFMLSPTFAHSHRRNPSAPPAVIVQPTRTPGLLSLSKPLRPSPLQQRQLHAPQRQQQRFIPKPRLPPSSSTPVVAQRPTPADNTNSDKKPSLPAPANPTCSPQPRGRAHAKHPKEKTISPSRTLIRSASHNSLRARPARQPSPPLPPPMKTPQAEGPSVKPSQSSNLFDPFLDDAVPVKLEPTLTNKPSGKLPRHRQSQAVFTAGRVPSTPTASPVSSKAIPVPNANRVHVPNLSHSDPVLSHMPLHRIARRSSTAGSVAWDVFPICDDMTDAGDLSDNGRSPPVTPTRGKPRREFNTGPRTAPLAGAFSFAPLSAPQNKSRAAERRHKRSPSEGVFNMSSDEDSSGLTLNPSVLALFQLARSPAPGKKLHALPYKVAAPKFARDTAPAAMQTKERQYEKEAAEKVAGYFASSSFQNSPSPEELPDPLFV
ncbi:hypothetical protein AX17_002541 [Amanita inopinata Kibby_2008]|nr:hypothetical protein AX17_002541 [Amanita inopinata Kibby_2008]